MSVILLDPLLDPRWDPFVESHPFGLVYHLSAWKRVLESSFPHMKGYYFALVDSSDNIQAALPVYLVDSWLTGRRLVSIPFATLCDPLVSDSGQLHTLLQAVFEFHRQMGSSYVEIRGLESAPLLNGNRPLFASVRQYKHHYLPLSSDHEAVRRTFHRKSMKHVINGLARSGLALVDVSTVEEFKDFYRIYFETRKRLSLPPQPFSFFHAIWQRFSESGRFQVLLACLDDQPVASLAFFKFKNRVSLEYGGWDTRYVDKRPNHFLYWEAIKLACREGYDVFDFGRTSPDNTGLMVFKSRWGTTEVDLPQFFYPARTAETARNRPQYNHRALLQKAFHPRMPDVMARKIGDFCYRHLG